MAGAKFNQGIIQPTLIDQLRGILEQYPDDNQILKVNKYYKMNYKSRINI